MRRGKAERSMPKAHTRHSIFQSSFFKAQRPVLFSRPSPPRSSLRPEPGVRPGIPSRPHFSAPSVRGYSRGDGPRDEERPGRPSKLSDVEREQVREDLEQSPQDFGYESEVWPTKTGGKKYD
ncbi:hypothetical protein AKJ49_00595 [candidate division MSBL1 archaeon SCGC-AAA382A03]|uniref:Uncharacterized protein n=1 Tax=candidate division MSBL1 archaeon SCGC-AAA382A03 TaxID=1698278 RepID=A0A133VGE6_9EURY|nr:hypothetical protein AKJ49_00595 [candidate division MSBL1 archaeon SCGC-AAA382A03]